MDFKKPEAEILKLRMAPDEHLFKECVPYQPMVESFDTILSGYMIDFVRKWNQDPTKKIKCVGLAAPQIGENKRLFVMWPNWRDPKDPGIRICFNPKITKLGKEIVKENESCLSVPGAVREKSRYAVITVQYFNERGQMIEETLKRWEARIFQHELDHLDGILCMKAEGKMRTYASDL